MGSKDLPKSFTFRASSLTNPASSFAFRRGTVVGDVDPNTEIFGVTLSKAMSLDEGRTLLASQDIPTLLDLILCNLEYKGTSFGLRSTLSYFNLALDNTPAAHAGS